MYVSPQSCTVKFFIWCPWAACRLWVSGLFLKLRIFLPDCLWKTYPECLLEIQVTDSIQGQWLPRICVVDMSPGWALTHYIWRTHDLRERDSGNISFMWQEHCLEPMCDFQNQLLPKHRFCSFGGVTCMCLFKMRSYLMSMWFKNPWRWDDGCCDKREDERTEYMCSSWC